MKWQIRGGRPLSGSVRLPGDKSITHRALIIGAMAVGDTRIRGAGWGADCQSTLACLESLGVRTERTSSDEIIVHGAGGRFGRAGRLDCGNSGTTMRLLAGVLAGQPHSTCLDGDGSLRRRPMSRVAEPLRAMGATVTTAPGGHAPLLVSGGRLRGVDWRTEVASAQVKSAILLAGLDAAGPTTVREPSRSRDHTERMLRAAGVEVITADERTVTLIPGEPPRALDVSVPADFSAAAFWVAAATAVPESQLALTGVGLNPTRTGLLDVLAVMGGGIGGSDERMESGEPVGTLRVGASSLYACEINGGSIPRLIDELPLIAVLATQAHGRTIVRDARELRVKESDRISAMADGLRRFGAEVEELADGWVIDGPQELIATSVDCGGDHRVAMALSVAAMMAQGTSEIGGVECVAVSDPFFEANLRSIGSLIER